MSARYFFSKISETRFYLEGPGIDSSNLLLQFSDRTQAAIITNALNEAYRFGEDEVRERMHELLLIKK